MSTKTISKRVALATVVALGAGVLSLVSVSSANAADNAAVGSANATTAAGTLNIATLANTTGAAVVSGSNNAGVKSNGLLSVSDIAGNRYAGTSQTATLLSTGTIVVYTTGASNTGTAFTVSGGIISSTNGDGSSSATYGSGNAVVATSGTGFIAFAISPNAGVSSMTINEYTLTGAGTTQAGLLATPTSGTLVGSIAVSIATASTSGTISLTKSAIYYNSLSNGASQTTANTTSQTTTIGVGTSDYATAQYATVLPKDAYGVLLGAGNLVQATATNGANVALSASGSSMATAPTSAGTMSTSFTTTYGSTGVGMAVSAGTLTTGGQTIVTVSVNGVAIGTVSFTFTGVVSKVTLSSAYNGAISGSNLGNSFTVAMYDASGNQIFWPAGASTAAYPQSLTKDANGFKGFGTGLGTITWPNRTVATGATTAGYALFTCNQNATDAAQLDYTNANGTVVVSNSLPFSCSGSPATYTAALDASTYTPGSIATLTVTFKDSTGALAADVYAGTALSGGTVTSTGIANGTTAPSITSGDMTIVSATTSTDGTTNGVVKYKFIVGSTGDGTYQLVASFPVVNAVLGTAQTVSYKVSSGSTSLNDVLKGIVSLIASINKQIAALAKLVTKK
jgi:hypothetical protein